MGNIVISKRNIIVKSKEIIQKYGINAISIRKVAAECDVSVGTIYNYFDSKDDLLLCVIEETWKDIFHVADGANEFDNFAECVQYVFDCIKRGVSEFENFFDFHSMSIATSDTVKSVIVVERNFNHIKEKMINFLKNDKNVRKDAFNEAYNEKIFVDMVFTTILTSLLRKKDLRDVVVESVKRCIY